MPAIFQTKLELFTFLHYYRTRLVTQQNRPNRDSHFQSWFDALWVIVRWFSEYQNWKYEEADCTNAMWRTVPFLEKYLLLECCRLFDHYSFMMCYYTSAVISWRNKRHTVFKTEVNVFSKNGTVLHIAVQSASSYFQFWCSENRQNITHNASLIWKCDLVYSQYILAHVCVHVPLLVQTLQCIEKLIN